MNELQKKTLVTLFESWAGEAMLSLENLAQSGSDRQYFRAKSKHKKALIAYNTSDIENQIFIDYTKHFRQKGIALPAVYATALEQKGYLLEDLGDSTLLHFLEEHRTGETFPDSAIYYYKKALANLAFMQIKGVEGLEVEKYHQPATFDKQAMLWDTQYFKYCFLKTCKLEFDEQLLEQDFEILTSYLASQPQHFFLFRDFQARNIMIYDKNAYFIDYQGGKLGALQYDVVSLLFQAKANLPNSLREELLTYYIEEASKYTPIDAPTFRDSYYTFVLMRLLQVLGAYGFKGRYERKKHFLDSIPYALDNLTWLLTNIQFPIQINYLKSILETLIITEKEEKKIAPINDKLTVTIQSFSYKNGIPEDKSGNGGGFVFDCRFVHNPGRYEPYKKLTGRDSAVIDFFKENSKIEEFAEQVKGIVDEAVGSYIERGFLNLSICFGCTGGQHRSVFMADTIAKYLGEKYLINVVLWHREQERKNWKN